VYLAGKGVGADPAYAATLLARVCDRGNARACFELARLYKAGEGVKSNGKRAADLFEKACKLGLDEGCLAASRTGDVLSPRD
jgi:TPR repeat protein